MGVPRKNNNNAIHKFKFSLDMKGGVNMEFIGGMFVGAIVGFFAAIFCVAANDDDERGDRNDD